MFYCKCRSSGWHCMARGNPPLQGGHVLCRMIAKVPLLLLLLLSLQHAPMQCSARDEREPRTDNRSPRIDNRAPRGARVLSEDTEPSTPITEPAPCEGKSDGQTCGAAAGPCSLGSFCVNEKCVETFKSATFTCRSATSECAPSTRCRGDSAACPTQVGSHITILCTVSR